MVLINYGCASSYKVAEPEKLNYISYSSNNELKLFYKYDVLKNKYAKKEMRSDIKLVALKIENNTSKSYVFGKNLFLEFSNGEPVTIVDVESTYNTLKQGSAIYLLYLLATPFNLYTYETNSYGIKEETSSTPIGLVIGPGLTAGNMIASGSANKKFKKQLENNYLINKKIPPKKTTYGLLPIKINNFDALHLKVKN